MIWAILVMVVYCFVAAVLFRLLRSEKVINRLLIPEKDVGRFDLKSFRKCMFYVYLVAGVGFSLIAIIQYNSGNLLRSTLLFSGWTALFVVANLIVQAHCRI